MFCPVLNLNRYVITCTIRCFIVSVGQGNSACYLTLTHFVVILLDLMSVAERMLGSTVKQPCTQ